MDDNLAQADRHMIEAVLVKVNGWIELTTSDLLPVRRCDEIGLDLQRRCTELMAELDGVRAFMVVAPRVKTIIDRLNAIGEVIEGFHDYVAKEFGNDPDDSAAAWKTLMQQIDKAISEARNLKGKRIKALTELESKRYGQWKRMRERLVAEGRKSTVKAVYDALMDHKQLRDGDQFDTFYQTVKRAKRKLGEGRRPKMDKVKGAGSIDKSRFKPGQDQDDSDDFHLDDD